MKYHLSLYIISFIILAGCAKKEVIVKGPIYFNTVAPESSGIDFSNELVHKDDMNIIEYLYYYNGGGVAVGDINNDGLDDIYFTANQSSDKLYLNTGNLKFKDITTSSGMQIDSTWSTGATMEDVNNDGYLDIYVSKVGNYKGLKAHNLLYINNKDNTFTESSAIYGLDFSGFSTQASFFDYDNDGDMDMYLLNHSIHTPRSYGKASKRMESDSLSGDRLYENQLNEGLSKFIDVTAKAGIYNSPLGYGLGLVTSDINQDGFIDIYVGNDFHENDYIYLNQGNKTFKEVGADFLSHTSRFTMGVDIADINNDNKVDIFSLDMMPYDPSIFLKSGGEDSDKVSQIKESFGFSPQYARNHLQLNNDNKFFSDVALMTETHASDWSWSVLMEDYDNDGLADIFITNGIYKRPNDLDYIKFLSNVDFNKYSQNQQNEIEKKLIDEMPTVNISNIIFRNKGNMEFERLTEQSGFSPTYSNGAAYSDLDNDGDLDLVVNNINQKALLLENQSAKGPKNNYITIALEGDDQLKNTTGTKVYVYSSGSQYYKELNPTRGFQSSSSHKLHFGLGSNAKIDSIQLLWLDGTLQTEKGLTINQSHKIKRRGIPNIARTETINTASNYSPFPYKHVENMYLDYAREPLIPEKLSVEGPAVVSADFNNDGLNDIFIGGARQQAPELLIQQTNGEYKNTNQETLEPEAGYEDVDATAFDLDHDGDLDIYVMSGGNDKLEGDPLLEDRIYLNDGNGNFKRFESTLPTTNGGSISAGDFNGDGFDDLFIGSRSIPGAYGLSPYSLILKNTGKSSFEIVEKTRFGMVTDSYWSDINNDNLLDLIIVGDWMPVTIMLNKGDSTFSNETNKYGLDKTEGMWNTIAVSDLDGNGFKDIIVGNAGLNFKWKASTEKPVKLYLDDFDKNDQLDPIIFYNFFGKNVPFASKDNLLGQLPSLKKNFLSYKDYSNFKDIEGLTGKPESAILEIKTINELRSMVFLNNGKELIGSPLPKSAQMSSIEDIYIGEEQGKPVLVFVGNYLDNVTELGPNDANSGGILSSFDKKEFRSFVPINIPKHLNARRIVRLDNGSYLVLANNDNAYIFNPSNN